MTTENLDPKTLTDQELVRYANASGFRENDVWFKELAKRAEVLLQFYDDVEKDWEE